MQYRISTFGPGRRAPGIGLVVVIVLVLLLGPISHTSGAEAPDLAPQAIWQDGYNPHQPISNQMAGVQAPVTLASDAPAGGARNVADLRSTEAIYLPDTRTRVATPSSSSWRWNVHLEAYWPTYYVTCTGWLVGPHTVITAGHCVYWPDDGWATEVKVTPALNGASAPFGSQWSADFWIPTAWVSGDARYDYGAIILPNDTMGNAVGVFMPYGVFSDSFLYDSTGTIAIAGYPEDKHVNGLYGTALWVGRGRRVTYLDDVMAYYQVDTYWGQSGAAVWTTYKGNRFAIGIHTQSYCGFYENCGIRITEDVADFIEFVGGGPPLTDLVPGPTLLTPADDTLTNQPVTFNWILRPEAAKYEMEIWKWVCSTLECTWRRTIRKTLLGPPVTLNLGTGYYWWSVRSIQSNQIPGQWSDWQWLEVDKRRPGRPIPWYPPNGSTTIDTTPTVAWDMPVTDTDIDFYEVQFSLYPTFSTIYGWANTPNNWFTVPVPLAPNKWYWRVRAYDYVGNIGPWSPAWNFVVVLTTGTMENQPITPPIITVNPTQAPVVAPPALEKQAPPDGIISVGPLPGEQPPVTSPDEPPPVTPPPAPTDPVEPPPVELPPVEPPRDAPPADPNPGDLPPDVKPPMAQ